MKDPFVFGCILAVLIGGLYVVVTSPLIGDPPPKFPDNLVPSVPIYCSGDVNSDGIVDDNDLDLIQASMGHRYDQDGYNSRADIDRNRIVNDADLRLGEAGLGCRYQYLDFQTIMMRESGITGPAVNDPVLVVADNVSQWEAEMGRLNSMDARIAWLNHTGGYAIPLLPDLEVFQNNTVIGVFAGPSGAGTVLQITDVVHQQGVLTIKAELNRLPAGCSVIQVVTFPFHIIRVEKIFAAFELKVTPSVKGTCD